MAGYYYLGAQLPLLSFDREPGISPESFREEAGKWLQGPDRAALAAAALGQTAADGALPRVLQACREFEHNLRSDLAAWRRSVRTGQDYKPVHFPVALVKESDPLEAERKLLRLRWDFFAELEVGHFFDSEFILLYYLKLQVLHRLFLFHKEKGLKVFNQLCEVSV